MMRVDIAMICHPLRLFRVNRATERVEKMLQDLFAPELQGGLLFQRLPSSIFEDPYIFGYFGAAAMAAADLISAEYFQNKMSVDDKARVARGAVIALSGMGLEKYAVVNESISRNKKEFLEGMRQAQRMVAVMHGQLLAADDPEIAETFKDALKMPDGIVHTTAVAAAMLKEAHLGRRLKTLTEKARR
jgi:hypothetical protein